MDMLLRHVTIEDLAHILQAHQARSPLPELFDENVRQRAVKLARSNGLWQALDEELDRERPITVVRRSLAREFSRTGERARAEQEIGHRRKRLHQAALALWLSHPKADLDDLQDLIWAFCHDDTWVSPAHPRPIDLGAAQFAASLAEIVHLFKHQLEPEIIERVHTELVERIYNPFWDWTHPQSWQTARHNWNHVINGEIVRTALYDIDSPTLLAHMIHPAINHMTYAIDGFGDDGGCFEGPSYWDYGFGHYLKASYALYQKTAGAINLMREEKLQAICRFPLATDLDAPIRATFSDAAYGYLSTEHVLLANRFIALPELYRLAAQHDDGSLRLSSLRELALYGGEKAPQTPDLRDYFLPDLGFVKLRGTPSVHSLSLTAVASHNGANHNHNDLGSFMLYRDKTAYIVDPGRPRYRRDTFSSRRYESLFCNSWGHSVPIINGLGQPAGRTFYARMTIENLNQSPTKVCRVDLTRAYAPGLLARFERVFRLDQAQMHLLDTFHFHTVPSELEEAFITFEPARLVDQDQAVCLGSGPFMQVSSHSPGRFVLEPRPEAALDDVQGRTLMRVLFVPETLATEMTLGFTFG